jgi:hypothetical protein
MFGLSFITEIMADAVIVVVTLITSLKLLHAFYRHYRRQQLIRRRQELKRLEH